MTRFGDKKVNVRDGENHPRPEKEKDSVTHGRDHLPHEEVSIFFPSFPSWETHIGHSTANRKVTQP
jgi:hypothetical protein